VRSAELKPPRIASARAILNAACSGQGGSGRLMTSARWLRRRRCRLRRPAGLRRLGPGPLRALLRPLWRNVRGGLRDPGGGRAVRQPGRRVSRASGPCSRNPDQRRTSRASQSRRRSADTPQEVFETFGAPLGQYLIAMPDGEVGPAAATGSAACITRCSPRTRARNRAAPGAGRERGGAAVPHAADAWHFGQGRRQEVRFGDPGWRPGYARDALNSYFVFRVMKGAACCRSTCVQVSFRWSTACCRRASFPTRRTSPDRARLRRRDAPRSRPSS
jgi:hypothetical protein